MSESGMSSLQSDPVCFLTVNCFFFLLFFSSKLYIRCWLPACGSVKLNRWHGRVSPIQLDGTTGYSHFDLLIEWEQRWNCKPSFEGDWCDSGAALLCSCRYYSELCVFFFSCSALRFCSFHCTDSSSWQGASQPGLGRVEHLFSHILFKKCWALKYEHMNLSSGSEPIPLQACEVAPTYNRRRRLCPWNLRHVVPSMGYQVIRAGLYVYVCICVCVLYV